MFHSFHFLTIKPKIDMTKTTMANLDIVFQINAIHSKSDKFSPIINQV
jgi:hypothetical protein